MPGLRRGGRCLAFPSSWSLLLGVDGVVEFDEPSVPPAGHGCAEGWRSGFDPAVIEVDDALHVRLGVVVAFLPRIPLGGHLLPLLEGTTGGVFGLADGRFVSALDRVRAGGA